MARLGLLATVSASDKHMRLSLAQLRQNLSDALVYVARRKKSIVLTKHGIDEAALVDIALLVDLESLAGITTSEVPAEVVARLMALLQRHNISG